MNPQPTVLETATLPIELLPYLPNLVCLSDKSETAGFMVPRSESGNGSGNDFRHATGANRAAAFADREALALFHRDRRDQFNLH